MNQIMEFLQSETAVLILFFSFLALAILGYVLFTKKKKRSQEKMRSEERTLKLPQKDDEAVQESNNHAKQTDYSGEEENAIPEESITTNEGSVEYAAIQYSYSYFAHLHVAPEASQERYNEIKKLIMTYEGISASITFKEERFIYLGKTVIKFRIISNVLRIYLALDKEDIAKINIKTQDLSAMKEHQRTPSLIRVSGNTGVKRAKEAIILLMEKQGIKVKEELSEQNYIPEPKTFAELVALDYIRKK